MVIYEQEYIIYKTTNIYICIHMYTYDHEYYLFNGVC